MEPIKIEVAINVNVDMSQGTKDFVREVINRQIQAKSESADRALEPLKSVLTMLQAGFSAAPVPVTPEMPTPLESEAPTPDPAPAQPEPEPEPAQPEPAPSKEKQGTAPTVNIEDVRKALAEKVNDHRAAIKDKLTSFGAPSVTKLDPARYQEMYDFLKSL